MTQSTQKHGTNSMRRVNEARRHFLGLAAAVAARTAAAGTLAAMVLPSSANAAKKVKEPKGRGPKGGGEPACFLRGTSILTSSGAVRVEDLERGDRVVTVDGETLPVQWIGRRTYRKSGFYWPKEVMPIRVARDALAEQTPHSDLYLSPGHALLIDGVLFLVRDLVNGASIAAALPDDMEEIEYFHVVLASHEVILAEGAPAETFRLWDRNHEKFTNFIEYERLCPDRIGFKMRSYAHLAGAESGRTHLKALLSLAVFPFIPVRNPVEEARHKLALRAETVVN
jgi:hypothetical protein